MLSAEAEERDMTVPGLLATETDADAVISDVEISVWFEENRSNLAGRTLDQVRDQFKD